MHEAPAASFALKIAVEVPRVKTSNPRGSASWECVVLGVRNTYKELRGPDLCAFAFDTTPFLNWEECMGLCCWIVYSVRVWFGRTFSFVWQCVLEGQVLLTWLRSRAASSVNKVTMTRAPCTYKFYLFGTEPKLHRAFSVETLVATNFVQRGPLVQVLVLGWVLVSQVVSSNCWVRSKKPTRLCFDILFLIGQLQGLPKSSL
eukprot:jgi/Botrbrau1/22544/Bobra.114_2s0067.1